MKYEVKKHDNSSVIMRILKKSVIISLLKGLVVEGEEVFHQDILGSNVMLTDENGDWSEKTLFGPFGNIISEQKTLLTSNIDHLSSNYNFTGKERDSESNLDYFGARYLDYNNGRWMKPDLIAGNLGNPQSLNKYVYCNNNPVKYIDPTGRKPESPYDSWEWLYNNIPFLHYVIDTYNIEIYKYKDPNIWGAETDLDYKFKDNVLSLWATIFVPFNLSPAMQRRAIAHEIVETYIQFKWVEMLSQEALMTGIAQNSLWFDTRYSDFLVYLWEKEHINEFGLSKEEKEEWQTGWNNFIEKNFGTEEDAIVALEWFIFAINIQALIEYNQSLWNPDLLEGHYGK